MEIVAIIYTKETADNAQETTLAKEKPSKLFRINAAICTEWKQILYLNRKGIFKILKFCIVKYRFFGVGMYIL